MHAIYFYKDKQGNQPVLDYMRQLARHDSKDSRIKLNKLNDYIELLSQHGTRAGQPYIKHLDAEIWELRPCGIGFYSCLAGWELCPTASFCQKDAKDTQTRDRKSQARVARFEGKRAKR